MDILLKISADAWVQTFGGIIGAALGAYLGARYASKLALSQTKEHSKLEDKKSLLLMLNFFDNYSKDIGLKVIEFNKQTLLVLKGEKNSVLDQIELVNKQRKISKRIHLALEKYNLELEFFAQTQDYLDILDELCEKEEHIISLFKEYSFLENRAELKEENIIVVQNYMNDIISKSERLTEIQENITKYIQSKVREFKES